MAEEAEKYRSLALDPIWSVACALTMFVAVSLLVERSIHRLSSWLQKTNRKPLYEALEKMKEELMLLGFISLLLTATSNTISNICINSIFYVGNFTPCTKSEIEAADAEAGSEVNRKLLSYFVPHHSVRRRLIVSGPNSCKEGYEPFVSYEGLEELHRFIFVMAITHISYSCLTMLLAILKVHAWRQWEDEAHKEKHEAFTEIAIEVSTRRQSMIVKFHTSNPLGRNTFLVWLTCFLQQFGQSVVRVDYLALRMGFIMNHNLSFKYDFHSYMIRSMEEEFRRIVGVSAPLWGFVVTFMLFTIQGSNLYFWIAIIPLILVFVVGTKLQHIIATLAWENAGITGFFSGTRLKPRDDLFWFRKPEVFLSLIHFVLFQNSFELASFIWVWSQFGYNSCFISNHLLLYIRLILGFAGQFLCSYSTLPLYALVTQMGTNYKAALIPKRIRDTLHGLNKDAKRKRRRRIFGESSTRSTDTRPVFSLEEDERQLYYSAHSQVELPTLTTRTIPAVGSNENSSRGGTPLLRSSTSLSSTTNTGFQSAFLRSSSVPSSKE